MDKLKKVFDAFLYLIPLLSVYPRWAQILFIFATIFIVASVVVFVSLLPQAKANLDPSHRARLNSSPYPEFEAKFRPVIAAYRIPETGSFLHIVWGNIADISNCTVVLPVSQSFDFMQRGPRSVLAAFEGHKVNGLAFYSYLSQKWPQGEHPMAAAIGTTKFFPFFAESNDLNGALFVVTTRDCGSDPQHYGLYTNTPLDGIDYVLDCVLTEVNEQKLSSIAIPLLGAGYANIHRIQQDSEFKALLEHAVTLLTVEKLLTVLSDPFSELRRGTVVVYSSDPHGESEDKLWKNTLGFIQANIDGRKKQIDKIIEQIREEG